MIKKIVIGCDHLGRELKDTLKEHLTSKGIEVTDIGVNSDDSVDYPDVGKDLAKRVQNKEFERGILVCGQEQEWQLWLTSFLECVQFV